jgi:exosortase
MSNPPDSRGQRIRLGIAALVLLQAAALLWAYWPVLRSLAHQWSEGSRYTHGYLVPVFSAFLLWRRRADLTGVTLHPNFWGLTLIAAGAALRLAGVILYFDWFEAMSLLPVLAGFSVLFGGWKALRWSAPAIVFLAFMVPLPFQLESLLGWPLQRLATISSTYLLQTMGLPALGEGNVIVMNEARIGVVEACSGLSMLVLFFAIATGVAMLADRSWIDRVVIVASAIPIALIANIARITITGVLHETVGERIANIVFHDLAGWLMMPLAVILLGIELRLLDWVLYEPQPGVHGGLAPVGSAGNGVPRPLPDRQLDDRHAGPRSRPVRVARPS